MADNKEEISELIDKRGTYKAKSLSLSTVTSGGGAYVRRGSHGCFPSCGGLCESYERITPSAGRAARRRVPVERDR
ncbi:hypothetical protein HZH68_003232 [Vespula germanica]|uniref:Uncharacterized protein n=2 Tax=Vespula TaxID=7451 RepID=A0A834NNT5_VESGE|nr:hypothetical protein HZH66_002902 [Vespula vulgaris]KAF7414743.1 hypothetical protein HZH68_003232 [Vespula germanica]